MNEHTHCSCPSHESHISGHDNCSCSHEHGHDACSCGHSHGSTEHIRPMLIRILIGTAFFAAGFLFNGLVSNIFFIISYVLLGYDVLWSALKNILNGHLFDENFLMSIATIGAFIIGELPEGVAVMLFYQVGELFQNIAVSRSRKSITDLMDIRPDYANILRGENYEKVSPEQVHPGDIILIKAGEKVPLDGIVTDGNAALDTSALTGESVPRNVSVGDSVLSGTLNTNGTLSVRVEKEFGQSTASKILDLVQNAAEKKTSSEKFITRFARFYTPIVVAAAVLLAIIPPLVTWSDFTPWIYRALIFLVVSCPCALVVSVPLGFFGGIGCASRNGILLKGSGYLEMLTKLDTVILDKTGTITEGVFEVTHTEGSPNLAEVAAYAEFYSNHPIAESIKRYYAKTINSSRIADYTEIAGHGIRVKIDGKEALAGNQKLMEQNNIICKLPKTSGTIVHAALDGQYLGYILISDKIKSDSQNAIVQMNQMGLETVMLTGDNQQTADEIARAVGIQKVCAELLPDQKVSQLETFLQTGKRVAFTGDGINDAPVLTRADVGIAMGGVGSDAAIEAADVVIMTDELSKIPSAIKISKATMRIVWQNIIFAIGVKVLIMLLSIAGLSTMWVAIFGDVGVSLLAVANSIRALYIKTA